MDFSRHKKTILNHTYTRNETGQARGTSTHNRPLNCSLLAGEKKGVAFLVVWGKWLKKKDEGQYALKGQRAKQQLYEPERLFNPSLALGLSVMENNKKKKKRSQHTHLFRAQGEERIKACAYQCHLDERNHKNKSTSSRRERVRVAKPLRNHFCNIPSDSLCGDCSAAGGG